jgi:hypothetical protein
VEDKIREVPCRSDASIRANLREMGVPHGDHMYVFLSAQNRAYAIMSQDADLYEPRAKTWSPTARRTLMHGNAGCVRRYFEEELGCIGFPSGDRASAL